MNVGSHSGDRNVSAVMGTSRISHEWRLVLGTTATVADVSYDYSPASAQAVTAGTYSSRGVVASLPFF